jgi:adenylate cyclase
MPSITFTPDNRRERTEPEETILETAQRTKVPLIHVCMGNGRCSTCRIQVVEGLANITPRTEQEQDIAERMKFTEDIRLSCQTKACGDVKIRRLVLDPDDVEVTSLILGGAVPGQVGTEKEVVILMADIRNFTAMADFLLPYDAMHILNRYFYLMSEVISRYGGQIDNYMGDGLVAFFEVTDRKKDILKAIRAAFEMLDVVKKRIRSYVKEHFGREFRIGIGLHYGLAICGLIGARENKRHAIIGDSVNFASRVESVNKELGTQFLISEDVYSRIYRNIKVRRIHSIRIKGKRGLHTVYEVSGLAK